MTKSEYLLIAILAVVVCWLYPQVSQAQGGMEPEESPVRSECQASVSITPTNTRPQSAFGTTLYDYRVDVTTDTKECASVVFRVYATPTQADGKILLDGGEPTIMSVCKGRESAEDSLQVHSMSRRIPLNVDHVSCKLRSSAMQKSDGPQENRVGRTGGEVTSKDQCPYIECICNNDGFFAGFTFNRASQCCMPQEDLCRFACKDSRGWTGIAWDPRLQPHPASVDECPPYACQCENGGTTNNARLPDNSGSCFPQNAACFYWCKQNGS